MDGSAEKCGKLEKRMGLDDFITEDEYAEGEVKTRKKIKNVKLGEETWDHLIIHDPHWASIIANKGSEEEAKAIVQRIDEILQGEADLHVEVSEDELDKIRNEREDIIKRFRE